MKKQSICITLSLCLLLVISTSCKQQSLKSSRPNVVIIFMDDLGYADVGIYGAKGFKTPNIDRMAAEGMRFTQMYMPASSCSPSRAALMTGCYPLRAGIPNVLFPRAKIGLNPEEVTIAELLKEQGYATMAIGKWHLGDHPEFLPTNHGFDSYFGLPYSNDMSPDPKNNPRASASRHPPLPLIRDTTIIEREPDQSILTQRYTDEAIAFIEKNKDQPFFLYLAHTMVHVPLYVSDRFKGSSEQGMYGDVMQEIDWSTGQILELLERLNLDKNTLVVFTSDNGPWTIFGDHAGSARPLREGKASSFEGGHRVPGIFRYPGRIPANTVSDELATVMDLLPTIAKLAGAEMPQDRVIDGYDIRTVLFGEQNARSLYEKFYYYRAGQLQAVRSGKWKLHVPHAYLSVDGGVIADGGAVGRYAQKEIELSLFDLDSDISEMTNVAEQNPEVVARLMAYIEQGREEIGDKLTGNVGTQARMPGRVAETWSKQN